VGSPILVAAFQLDEWLKWIRRGFSPSHVAAVGSPSAVAAGGTYVLDVHRMNQAQARAAVLESLQAVVSAMPPDEVQAARVAAAEGADLRIVNGTYSSA
jgi:hypothetical protein